MPLTAVATVARCSIWREGARPRAQALSVWQDPVEWDFGLSFHCSCPVTYLLNNASKSTRASSRACPKSIKSIIGLSSEDHDDIHDKLSVEERPHVTPASGNDNQISAIKDRTSWIEWWGPRSPPRRSPMCSWCRRWRPSAMSCPRRLPTALRPPSAEAAPSAPPHPRTSFHSQRG